MPCEAWEQKIVSMYSRVEGNSDMVSMFTMAAIQDDAPSLRSFRLSFFLTYLFLWLDRWWAVEGFALLRCWVELRLGVFMFMVTSIYNETTIMMIRFLWRIVGCANVCLEWLWLIPRSVWQHDPWYWCDTGLGRRKEEKTRQTWRSKSHLRNLDGFTLQIVTMSIRYHDW